MESKYNPRLLGGSLRKFLRRGQAQPLPTKGYRSNSLLRAGR